MSFQFILGPAGSGKTHFCINEISMRMKNNDEKVIFIVPDQMTFQMEYELVKKAENRGMLNSQVFSFSRLAWKVLQETGGMSRTHISDVGISILLRKIIEERKEELKILKNVSNQQGFFDDLTKLMAEFKGFQVSSDALEEIIHRLEQEQSKNTMFVQQKLHDIRIVLDAFEEHVKDKYLDSEDYLNLLIKQIPTNEYVKNSIVYIDGYYDLAPQERSVVEALMKVCKEIKFSLTIDRAYDNGLPNELHLFYKPAVLYQQLLGLANENNQVIEEQVRLTNTENRFGHRKDLQHLEQNFDSRPIKPFLQSEDISIIGAVTKRAEVDAIAREITSLVKEKGYRYRDIAIFLRNSDDYSHLISTIFQSYEIPIFIEEKRSMMQHPMYRLLLAVIDIIQKNWRYDAIFTAYKTELLYPLQSHMKKRRERIDAFENFCIAYGMQGKKWTSEDRFTYRKYRSLDGVKATVTDEEKMFEEQINEDRALLVEPVQRLISELKNAKNTREMCIALYEFTEEIQLPEKLQRLRDEAEEQGRLLESKDHEQVWKGFVNLLDECVELIGDEKISRKTFFELLQTGIQSLQFANVPPSLDQVSVANFDHSRLQHVKCSYVIGVNEGVIPSKIREDGLLGDEARTLLIQNGIEVAPTSTYQLFAENFNMYVGLTRASERLTITYPLTTDDGKALAPSSLIARMKGLFPTIQQRFESGDISMRTHEEQLSYVTNKEMAVSNLVLQAQNWVVQEERANMDLWWTIYNVLIEDEQWKDQLFKALSSITYDNVAISLGEELSSELYGGELQGSVSRIELFHQCAYAHFARFGLQLQERDVYKFEAFDMGQLFHSALTVIGEALMREKKSWSNLSQDECDKLAQEVIEEIAPKFQRDILHSTNRYRFLKKKMQSVISKVSYILSKQEEVGEFRPIALEVGFGKNQTLSSYELPIGKNKKMNLGGRIDRIDEAVSENGDYLRIIDYKSRDKALKLSDVYYGLALQLLTYLDIAITNSQTLTGQKANPAGVLYFHVQNPIVDLGNKVDESDAEDELFKKFKMNGLLLGERESNVLMDRTLDQDGGSSSIVPVAIKKDGNYTKSSKVIDKEHYPLMSNYIKQKFTEAGEQILAGEVTANPYQQKNHVPCKFCSYQSICQFDKTIKGNEYRILPPLKDEDALQKMIEEVANNESRTK